jgi:hypothetical protein
MKLVKESLVNEKFTEDSDPIQDMGLGLVGTMLFIPSGWQKTDENTLQKIYEPENPEDGSEWKISEAKTRGEFINISLIHTYNDGSVINVEDLLLTPQQIEMFINNGLTKSI